MRVSSPIVAVDAEGDTVAVSTGRVLRLLDTADGLVTEREAPFAAQVLALGADHTVFVAAGDEIAALSLSGSPGPTSTSATGQVMWLAPTVGGGVAVVTRSEHDTSFVVLGPDLQEIAAPHSLGSVAIWGFNVVGESSAVAWGSKGPRPWEGDGDPWATVVAWADGSIEQTWTGEGLPSGAEIAAAANAQIAVAEGGSLRLATISALTSGAAVAIVAVGADGEIESLAISPDGSRVGLVSLGETSQSLGRLHTADAGTAEVEPIPSGVQPVALAIDDHGRIVLAGRRGADLVVVLVAEDGGPLVERGTIDVPRSIHRDDR